MEQNLKTLTQLPDQRSNLTFSGHVADLRNHIILGLIVIGAGMGLFHYFLLNSTILHLVSFLPTHQIIFLSPVEPIVFALKVDFIGSFLLTLPLLLFLAWHFVHPAIPASKLWHGAVVAIVPIFIVLGGLWYADRVVIPAMLSILTAVSIPGAQLAITGPEYLSFILTNLICTILGFCIPLILVTLVSLGMLTPRAIAAQRRYFYLGAAIAVAIITPTVDAFSFLLILIPILVLYELGIILSHIVNRFLKRSHHGN